MQDGITIQLQPSILLRNLIVALHSLVLVVLLVAQNLRSDIFFFVAIMVLLSLFYHLARLYYYSDANNSCYCWQFLLTEQGSIWVRKNNKWQMVSVLSNSFESIWVVIIIFKTPCASRGVILITRDSVSPDLFKKIRAVLR